jgi:hypothetical protein
MCSKSCPIVPRMSVPLPLQPSFLSLPTACRALHCLYIPIQRWSFRETFEDAPPGWVKPGGCQRLRVEVRISG